MTTPTDPDLEGPDVVRFFELAGPAARTVLEPLGRAWRTAGAQTELLASLDRADLWLLVVRGGSGAERAAPDDPALRTWRFRQVTP